MRASTRTLGSGSLTLLLYKFQGAEFYFKEWPELEGLQFREVIEAERARARDRALRPSFVAARFSPVPRNPTPPPAPLCPKIS